MRKIHDPNGAEYSCGQVRSRDEVLAFVAQKTSCLRAELSDSRRAGQGYRRDTQATSSMSQFRNDSFEFVRQVSAEASADAGAAAACAEQDATRAAAFAFVRQLAQDLSDGSFELPAFPEVALRVREALSDPEVSVDKIARIVLSEPVLSARLLRIANSAMMRRGSLEITDVRTAISRLGFEMVRNTAVSLAVDSAFKAPAHGPVRRQVENTRRHSVRVAVLSYVLAKRLADGVKPDEAMLTGLLHAIGRFYILMRADAFPELFEHPDVLQGLMQDWHPGVGRAIVEAWGFPEPIAVAVDEHEVLERDHAGRADVADIVLVANLLASRGEGAQADLPAMASIPACMKLKIDEQLGMRVLAESEQEILSMAQALGA